MSLGIYKAKTIESLTGVSATLLRAWERRYDFLSPERQSGNQRMYSEDDLRVLQAVQSLLKEGRSIGEVAALGRDGLLARPQSATLERNTLPETGSRYHGNDLAVSLSDLSAADLTTVYRLYTVVKGAYEAWTYWGGNPTPALISERIKPLHEPDFLRELRLLGAGRTYPALVRVALEDAGAGALHFLLGHQERWKDVAFVSLLARDQAKLMRNAFRDLDPPLRQADESLRLHDLPGFLGKLRLLIPDVSSDYVGPITCCCLETSTLDRVIYRLLAASPPLTGLQVQRLGPMTRWTLSSKRPVHWGHLGDDLSTRAISSACGDALDKAWGFKGHQGWFHWPVLDNQPGLPLCECDPA